MLEAFELLEYYEWIKSLIWLCRDEGKRQARVFLQHGLESLAVGALDDADMQFGLALKVSPNIARCLSSRKQRRLLEELALARCDKRLENIRRFSDLLDGLQKV